MIVCRTQGLDLSVTSGAFPVGAGLGSSAAFCVSMSAALLRAREAATTPPLDIVNAHAYAAEVLLHDEPSGVDNTVATYGGAIIFRKIPLLYTKTFSLPSSLRILLTNTHVRRETKTLVAGVRKLYDTDPTIVQENFDIIESVALSFVDKVLLNELTEKEFASMLETTQISLEALQVSHDSIRAICKTTAAFGMVTKLTGAGGGGCTITLIPSDCSRDSLAALVTALEAQGMTCLETTLGGTGVEWH